MSLDLFDLRDRVAIVTGSGRGLGKAIATGLADAGASVVVCARHTDEVEATAAAIKAAGGSALPTRVDTSDRESCRQLVETAVTAFGKVDILVNNAGIDIIEPAEDVDMELLVKGPRADVALVDAVVWLRGALGAAGEGQPARVPGQADMRGLVTS